MDIKKCCCKGGWRAGSAFSTSCCMLQHLQIMGWWHISIKSSASALLAKDSFTARSSPRCQQASPGVKLCLCLLASFSWCRVGYTNTKAVPWSRGKVCSQGLRTGSHPTSYRFVQSRIHFFTVGACEIQCYNICIRFSEVFFMYTAWPLRQGDVSETCVMDCDSAGVFLGKFCEIHLIPALLQPNPLIVKVTIAI